jgi:hypothetical protein
MEILMKGMGRLAGLALVLVLYLVSASRAAQTPARGEESCS